MRSLLEIHKINSLQCDNFSSCRAPKHKNKTEGKLFFRAAFLSFYILRETIKVASFSNKLIPYIICDPELGDVVWIIVQKFVLQLCNFECRN
jgi:hypothetical protein